MQHAMPRNVRPHNTETMQQTSVFSGENESRGMENMPYSWEEVVEIVDRRDWTTWGVVTRCLSKLLGVGIKVWDEYGVALSDVIERLGESDSSDSDSSDSDSFEADVINTDSLDSDSTDSDSSD
jgi:hypothetical protein